MLKFLNQQFIHDKKAELERVRSQREKAISVSREDEIFKLDNDVDALEREIRFIECMNVIYDAKLAELRVLVEQRIQLVVIGETYDELDNKIKTIKDELPISEITDILYDAKLEELKILFKTRTKILAIDDDEALEELDNKIEAAKRELTDLIGKRLELSEILKAERKASVFLSHSWEDKEFVRKLADDLASSGIKIWFDEAELRIGDSLIIKIQEAIDKFEYLAVIISRHSINSEWVKKEVEIAMNQEIKKKRIKVLPILKDHCELPWFLSGKVYADFTNSNKYQEALRKLIDGLTKI